MALAYAIFYGVQATADAPDLIKIQSAVATVAVKTPQAITPSATQLIDRAPKMEFVRQKDQA